MRGISFSNDPLANDLLVAIFPLFKDSQFEVMAATAEFDLTFSQLRMLFVLDREEAAPAINELADRVSLSVAAAGRAVDQMVRTGLLLRREDSEDRRVKRIGLSPKGSRALELIVAARRLAAERFVSAMDSDERVALTAAVAALGALTRAHFTAPCAVISNPPSATSP